MLWGVLSAQKNDSIFNCLLFEDQGTDGVLVTDYGYHKPANESWQKRTNYIHKKEGNEWKWFRM